MTVTASAVDWLLQSDEPGVVFQAKRDLLDEADPPEAAQVLAGPKVRALLAGQQEDGSFGVHAYAGETNDRGSIDTIDPEPIAK